MTRAGLAVAAMAVGLFPAGAAEAYLKLASRAGDRVVPVQWGPAPVRYFVTDAAVPGVRPLQFQEAVARAFATWQGVPDATVRFEFAGVVSGPPVQADGISVLGFEDRPELERVLGATRFLVNTQTGELLEADIFFNAALPWSVAPGGQAGRFDLESIALHEIGHLIGLGHSAIGWSEPRPDGGRRLIAAETAMFPLAFSAGNIDGRRLTADDMAGVSDIYPSFDFRRRTGSISGTVTRGGLGLFGAHVVAVHLTTGRLVGGFSLDERGTFAVAGLDPGPHLLRVEPLDAGEVDGFFDRSGGVDVAFRVLLVERLLVVPRGGNVEVDVRVQPR